MLQIHIPISCFIDDVCIHAAIIARHPLAAQSVAGAYYAFTIVDGAVIFQFGPWIKPDGEIERWEGSAFWDHCKAMADREFTIGVTSMNFALRKLVQCHAIDAKPGVCFEFNGVTVECEIVAPDDPRTIGDIAQALHKQWEIKQKAASEAYWTPERKAEAERQAAEAQAKMERRRNAIAAARERFSFKPSDPAAYEQYKRTNADGYGAAVVRYGEAWVALMEAKIEEGLSVAEAAEATQYEADCEGITGAMYGFAVRQLVTFWEHGEELRRWHNRKYDYEGDGVVNPAVLTIAPQQY